MIVHLERINDVIQFQAQSETGYTFSVGSESEHEGVRPMEMVALRVGGCSGIDILSILKKQRQSVDRFDVAVDGERATDAVPAVFTTLHVHHRLEGEMEPDEVRRAIELSLASSAPRGSACFSRGRMGEWECGGDGTYLPPHPVANSPLPPFRRSELSA